MPGSTDDSVRLGPFVIEGELARGGMGTIWRGRHAHQGVPVAIKALTTDGVLGPDNLSALANEVRAVAALNHPGIVMVFDHGQIPIEVEVQTEGALLADSPYIVMEYASMGSLHDLSCALSWRDVRYLLLCLLDALAHAHAHGLVHRDLKPANILLCSNEDARPGLKLTDFGLASSREQAHKTQKGQEMAGTPLYMAPEQFEGRWRDYGPWTDLYALGCIAFELVCGRPAFNGENYFHLIFSHLRKPPPSLEPKLHVPEGLERWIHRLLSKAPAERFQRAADAAWALMDLEHKDSLHLRSSLDVTLRGDWLAVDELAKLWHTPPQWTSSANREPASTISEHHSPTLISREVPVMASRRTPSVRSPSVVHHPMPRGWRPPTPPSVSAQLLGAGLGLYGLRTVPLVGRYKERDRIWETLFKVRHTGTPRAVVCRGAAGVGKSRLAEWICRRADALGAATFIQASHSAEHGFADGLAAMVLRWLRCGGLSRTRAQARLTEILAERSDTFTEAEQRALLEWLMPAPTVVGPMSALSADFSKESVNQRYELLTRLLAWDARDRPVIVWLDDVQWGSDALSFARHCLDSAPSLGVLFLLTADDEVLATQSHERAALERLVDHECAALEIVPPLNDEECLTLVHRLLGLSRALSRWVVERVEGNPLFAAQLVGDWVGRGMLTLGAGGFELVDEAKAMLPDSLHEVWQSHLHRLLGPLPQGSGLVVEVAAVLGQEVDAEELDATCAAMGVANSQEIVEALLESRMMLPTLTGWAFAHRMLRESLERAAKEAGRLSEIHLAAARALGALYPEGSPGNAEQVGLHLLQGQEGDRAIDLLLVAAAERVAQSDYPRALALIEALEGAFDPSMAFEDIRWAESRLLSANIHRLRWSFERAEALSSEAAELATSRGWSRIAAEALWLRGHAARGQGKRAEAAEHNARALAFFEDLKDIGGLARVHLNMAIVARLQGHLARAARLYEQALALFYELDDDAHCAKCLFGLAQCARQRRDMDRAKALFARARTINLEVGNIGESMNCLVGLAEVARYSGDLAQAEEGYREAARVQARLGSGEAVLQHLNLALVLLQRERFGEAQKEFAWGIEALAQTGQKHYLAWACACVLPCIAALDAEAWEEHFTRASTSLEETAMYDPDIAHCAAHAAQILSRSGRYSAAQQAWVLAGEQWEALGNKEEATAANDALLALTFKTEPH